MVIMVNSKFLKKIMVVGEKSILLQLAKFTDMAETAVGLLKDMLSLDDDKKVQINNRIKKLEKDADNLSMKLKQQITGGAISSNLMDNLLELVETCDDLLDKSYFISREIKRVHENAHKFDDDSRGTLESGYATCRKILEVSVDAISNVRILLEAKDSAVMDDSRNRIEMLEEQVDDLKDNLIDDLYRVSDTLPYLIFIHLTELAHKLDDMLDDCEDISNLVHTIDLSITR